MWASGGWEYVGSSFVPQTLRCHASATFGARRSRSLISARAKPDALLGMPRSAATWLDATAAGTVAALPSRAACSM